MATASDKLARARSASKAALARARGVAGQLKPLGYAAAAGFAGSYIAEFAQKQFTMINTHWWGRAVAMFAAAYLVRNKSRETALGLAGAAGFVAAEDRRLMAKTDTKGAEDTGDTGDTGEMENTGDTEGLQGATDTYSVEGARRIANAA